MKSDYDILMIGSGLGGLMTGALLSKYGKKVLVLEKNKHIGGSLQSFKYKGCDFSTGLHYVGSLNHGQNLYKLFNYFNLFDSVKFQPLDPDGFDVFNIGGKEYKFPVGWENFQIAMIDYFPDEKEAIENYVQKIRQIIDYQDIYNLKFNEKKENDLDPSLTINTWEYITGLTYNKQLQQVLSALNFVYAGEKDKTPLYVHALINHHYIQGSFRVDGSTSQISEHFEKVIKMNGGEVITDKKIVELKTAYDEIVSVHTSDGSSYIANDIISNLHPAATMDLIPDGGIRKSFRNRMKRKKNTLSAFAVHLVLKEGSFRYRNFNYNYYNSNDVWYASNYNEDAWPEHYMLHCKKPDNNTLHTQCIGLLTHMSYEEVEKWANKPISERGDEYELFKRTKAQKLIELASEQFPELKGNIIDYNVSTPLTYSTYLGTPQGAMYGTVRDYMNPIGSYITPKTKLKNLYFTGQNLNLHGIMGVSLSALITCAEFISIETLLKDINPDEN